MEINLDEMDLTAAESKATYEEIKAYVKEKTGLQVSNLYIAQIKRKCGLEVGQNYNLVKKMLRFHSVRRRKRQLLRQRWNILR